MNDMEKLAVLLPHWIEHNKNHKDEFNKWLAIIKSNGEDEIASLLEKAVLSLHEIDSVLSQIANITGTIPGKFSKDHTHHH